MKLEYGKSYVLKDGRETGPLTKAPDRCYKAHHYTFFSAKLDLAWDKHGSQYQTISCSSDISHEVPAAKPAWTITAGTYVQLRSGEKAWVVGKRPNGKWVVYDSEGDEFHMPADGQWPGSEGKDPCDIVGPWVQPPKMERKTVRMWAVLTSQGTFISTYSSELEAAEWAKGLCVEVVELTGTTTKEYPT